MNASAKTIDLQFMPRAHGGNQCGISRGGIAGQIRGEEERPRIDDDARVLEARADAERLLPTLELWRKRNDSLAAAGTKPPLLIVNTSGGGLRAMLWTYRCLQVADSLIGGGLMDRAVLVTGSSGGLIGAAYFRQLHLLQSDSVDPASPERLRELATDMLNPLGFSDDVTSPETLVEVFPALAPLLRERKGHLQLVNRTPVEEVLQDLGVLDFGKGFEAQSNVAVWRARGDHRQLVGEFSFQCKFRRREELSAKALKRCADFFELLQHEAQDWIRLGVTKTAAVYRLKGAPPLAHD